MGISIHYNGYLRSPEMLPKMVEEVVDIAKIHHWKHIVNETAFPEGSFGKKDFNDKLYGMSFTPPECETVGLNFLSNGKLISPFSWYQLKKTKGADRESLDWPVSVKTHFAGVAVHKIVIHLFDHLNKKYFRDFSMTDEATYWETRDEKIAEQNFNFLNGFMDAITDGLSNSDMKKGETFEAYFLRLLQKIHKERRGGTIEWQFKNHFLIR